MGVNFSGEVIDMATYWRLTPDGLVHKVWVLWDRSWLFPRGIVVWRVWIPLYPDWLWWRDAVRAAQAENDK